MLTLVKFGRLKLDSGFTFADDVNGTMYVKSDRYIAKGLKSGYAMERSDLVWADDSRIKPWWKSWTA